MRPDHATRLDEIERRLVWAQARQDLFELNLMATAEYLREQEMQAFNVPSLISIPAYTTAVLTDVFQAGYLTGTPPVLIHYVIGQIVQWKKVGGIYQDNGTHSSGLYYIRYEFDPVVGTLQASSWESTYSSSGGYEIVSGVKYPLQGVESPAITPTSTALQDLTVISGTITSTSPFTIVYDFSGTGAAYLYGSFSTVVTVVLT